ncbi:MAG: rhodanese-like domain-containing protein [Promethearchaeota archaeon]
MVKIFDLTVAAVGLTEKQLKNLDIQYEKIYIHPNNHAEYYPGAVPITIKLIFEVPSGKILGAQAVGGPGTEKRIDVVSTVMKFEGTVFDLEELELAYAPPFGSAKDPINMAGFVASNVLRGDHPIWHWYDLKKIKRNNSLLLDVRTPEEYEVGTIEGAINISDLEIRNRIKELPRNKNIYVFCEVGFRGYIVTQSLLQKGFKEVFNLSGGYKLYKMAKATTKEIAAACGPSKEMIEEILEDKVHKNENFIIVDACGLSCPGPLNAMIKALEQLPEDKRLKIYATDIGFKSSVEVYSKLNENISLINLKKEDGKLVAILEKKNGREKVLRETLEIKKLSRKETRKARPTPLSEITVDELFNRLNSDDSPELILDVRIPQEYYGLDGHIKGARLFPLGELIKNANKLEQFKDEEIVMVCYSGARSMMAARLLVKAGFKDVRNLTGGMMLWNRKGYPVERGKF